MAPHRLHIPFVSSEVEDLLLWRHPAQTFSLVAAVTSVYIFFEWSGVNIISALANILCLTIALAFVWNNFATFTGRATLPVPDLIKNGVKDSDVKAFADQATVYINKGLGFLFRLFSGKDVVLVGKVVALLSIIGKISNWFTLSGLLFTVFILAFTVPKTYELKKREIDSALAKLKDQLNTIYEKYVKPFFDRIPRSSGATAKPASDIPTPQRIAAEVEDAAGRAKTS